MENILINVLVEMPFSTSDQDTLCFDLLTPKPLASDNAANDLNTPVKYNFSNIDHASLDSSLLSTDWLTVFSQDDNINKAWESFSLYISSLSIPRWRKLLLLERTQLCLLICYI